MHVAVVGCGLIGQKRARNLGNHNLRAVFDVNARLAQALANQHPGCVVHDSLEAVVTRPDIDLVIIATSNNALAPAARLAIENGKHVLVEKPAGRAPTELQPLLPLAGARGVTVQVGFNHRFHPAFLRARTLVDEGAIGPLLYVRGRYGHGGRLGYDREWRADPEIAGGGELLDQGVHLIDLAHWFLGDFVDVRGHIRTYFWDMPVEDNGFLFLRTAQGQTAWLHASCTEWKNLFSFEIFGRDGKLQIDGLGGSYGVERLTFYKMRPEMGPPETTIWEYPGEDTSWRAQFANLVDCIGSGQTPLGTLEDALAALRVVHQVYAQNVRTELESVPKVA